MHWVVDNVIESLLIDHLSEVILPLFKNSNSPRLNLIRDKVI